jgi:hypothetical protein
MTMPKPVLALPLIAVSMSAMADWQSIYSDENFSIYADPAAITRNGELATMWTLYDFKVAETLPTSNPSQSEKTQKEFDCRKRKFRQLHTALYSGSMGKGNTISSNDQTADWMTFQKGSLNEIEWKTACGKD